ncbi:hypothetical protein B9Z19DRAFT_1066727 [Tuber borchii]|uniref:Uncharacterized protein n=1 Tax=Tuber borchii TaxID=42251 RepID=A0A2T6ZLD8_TUBBO|nr:hypothetical protein B9Z19DRAFT_1066727 [Tuber borchii]
MNTNMFDELKDTTIIDGLKFFVTNRVRPPAQRLYRCLTFSNKSERSHKGYSQNFNFTYVPAYHNHVSPSNSPPEQDETASATADQMRMQEQQTLEARVYAWMEGIPPEDELMDPNSNEADGASDSEREWVRAVSPSSIGSSVGRRRSSTSIIVGGEAADCFYHRDRRDAVMKGKAIEDEYARIVEALAPQMRSISQLSGTVSPKRVASKGDKKQNLAAGPSTTKPTQNTPPPAKFVHAALDIPETESLERLIQESIASGVAVQTPPPDLPQSSSQPYPFLKKSKSKRLSLWKRLTKH